MSEVPLYYDGCPVPILSEYTSVRYRFSANIQVSGTASEQIWALTQRAHSVTLARAMYRTPRVHSVSDVSHSAFALSNALARARAVYLSLFGCD